MCKTGTLGDYLGLPTFGTDISEGVTIPDAPCATNSRNYTTSVEVDSAMAAIRQDSVPAGLTCAGHFNTDGKGTVIFKTQRSATQLPKTVSSVGIYIGIVGASADAFVGCRGYVVHYGDDDTYQSDYPVEVIKSKDGVVGVVISSIDISKFSDTLGGLDLVINAPDSAEPLEFTGMEYNVGVSYYTLQSDVSYAKYPFATEGKPTLPRLLDFRLLLLYLMSPTPKLWFLANSRHLE